MKEERVVWQGVVLCGGEVFVRALVVKETSLRVSRHVRVERLDKVYPQKTWQEVSPSEPLYVATVSVALMMLQLNEVT
jgi:hypothetical protein